MAVRKRAFTPEKLFLATRRAPLDTVDSIDIQPANLAIRQKAALQ